jgi:hypothetical protein
VSFYLNHHYPENFSMRMYKRLYVVVEYFYYNATSEETPPTRKYGKDTRTQAPRLNNHLLRLP